MIQEFIVYAKQKLNVDKRLIAIYLIIYFSWGMGMDKFANLSIPIPQEK